MLKEFGPGNWGLANCSSLIRYGEKARERGGVAEEEGDGERRRGGDGKREEGRGRERERGAMAREREGEGEGDQKGVFYLAHPSLSR